MSVIDLKKTQNGILADAINKVSHFRYPEDHPEPLTGKQVLIYGAYEDFDVNWWGWYGAKQVTLGPHPLYLPWPKAGTAKFKFVPANLVDYFDGHVDVSWLTPADFDGQTIRDASARILLEKLIELCTSKGINWTGLFPDVQVPFIRYDNYRGYCFCFYFTVNVVVGPIYLKVPNGMF